MSDRPYAIVEALGAVEQARDLLVVLASGGIDEHADRLNRGVAEMAEVQHGAQPLRPADRRRSPRRYDGRLLKALVAHQLCACRDDHDRIVELLALIDLLLVGTDNPDDLLISTIRAVRGDEPTPEVVA